MKTWLWTGTLADAVALPALSGIAQAQKRPRKEHRPCSLHQYHVKGGITPFLLLTLLLH